MRKLLIAGLALMLVLAMMATAQEEATETPWFDMEKCEFCINMMEDPTLLPNTTWEHHNIANGIISVTTLTPGFKNKFTKAMAGMQAVEEKMKAGEKVEMCGMCNAMGGFMSKGTKWEQVETITGYVSLLTSGDVAVVADIQAWGTRTNDELAKMEEAMRE